MLYVFSTSTFCFHWIRDSSLLNFCYIEFFFGQKMKQKIYTITVETLMDFVKYILQTSWPWTWKLIPIGGVKKADWSYQRGKKAGRERGEGGGWEKHRSCAKNCSDKWNSDSLATCGWFRWLVEFLWPQSHGLYCSFRGNLSFWGCYWQRSSSHPPRLMATLKMEMWNVFSCFAPEFLGSGIFAFY